MKQLAILSGKGGTGKTTVASSFIKLAKNKAFADCDVDAPNLHLTFADDKVIDKSDYYGYKKAVKNYDICIDCGKCEEFCKFEAISDGILERLYCEGCGVCEFVCPVVDEDGKKAIRLEANLSGETSILDIGGEIFSTALLKMGNGASGKLVTQVKKNLYEKISGEDLVIIDGSPGIGCPVIASLAGIHTVLVVTEPTVSGISDMKRIIDIAEIFNTDIAVCINKYDVNEEKTKEIEEYISKKNIPLSGKIPFDPEVPIAMNQCKVIVDVEASLAANEIKNIWKKMVNFLGLGISKE